MKKIIICISVILIILFLFSCTNNKNNSSVFFKPVKFVSGAIWYGDDKVRIKNSDLIINKDGTAKFNCLDENNESYEYNLTWILYENDQKHIYLSCKDEKNVYGEIKGNIEYVDDLEGYSPYLAYNLTIPISLLKGEHSFICVFDFN